jgi:hypothetical protein
MRLIKKNTLSLLLTAIAACLAASAADNGQTSLVPSGRGDTGGSDRVAVQAILLVASDEGVTDASLSAYEATLKRVLRFKSYRRVGGGSTAPLAPGGEATVAIGGGYDLDVWVNRITDREVEYGVRWFKGRHTLSNTTFTRPRRSNTIVGGPATEDGKGTYAVIVTVD